MKTIITTDIHGCALELKYLDHFSPWEDIKIITLTAFSIISGKKF